MDGNFLVLFLSQKSFFHFIFRKKSSLSSSQKSFFPRKFILTSILLIRYLETLVHLFKGNVGSGLFAMGDAFRNAGIWTGIVLTITLGSICLHSQRLLVNCSNAMQKQFNREKCPDYAETVELCFLSGPKPLRKWAHLMRRIVNIFICLTQLGFCCIYFVFVSESVKQVRYLH